MGSLNDRVVLVTGAGRGIGRAIALAFAKSGARVAAAARSEGELRQVVDAMESLGGKGAAVTVDLRDRGEVHRVVDEVARIFGPVEVLVNNAGLGSSAHPAPVVETPDEFWDATLELNLTVPFRLAKDVVPGMIERGWGRVITVASIASRVGTLHGAAYAASKHGVLGLMRTLALETAGTGVTVNCICPGPVKTVMNDKRIAYDAQRLGVPVEQLEKTLTPIGGRLVPEEIAPMALYLAGDEGRMITGQAFNICGGLVMA